VRLDFDGGALTSDGGVVALGEVERRRQILSRFASCFEDHRDPERIEHDVRSLVSQRVLALALGYEDLNDHDELRADALLAAVIGSADPLGCRRKRARDRGKPLSGKSTLNRFEWGAVSPVATDRYRRIAVDEEAVQRFFVEVFLDSFEAPPQRLILDLDATDDPVHGTQEGRFFHGYYGHYCYLPLYVFCGDFPLWAELRPSDIDASKGSVEAVAQIVTQIRERFPSVELLLRADSGFAREPLMAWCEAHGVDFAFGLARNRRLERALGRELVEVARRYEQTGQPARSFTDLRYATRKTWSRERRVVGKAEHLSKGSNPRYVVTSLAKTEIEAEALYELYCQRGDMENRIKEQQLDLFADRTSAHRMKVNQLRLWCSTVAYLLLAELRRLGLAGTTWARAQCGTIRLRLLKIGARVRVTTRRIWISYSSAYPWKDGFLAMLGRLRSAPI